MTDPQGVKRTVEVNAESLFEAAVLAIHAFRKDEWTDFVANVLELAIREPAVKHQVSIAQVKRWLEGSV